MTKSYAQLLKEIDTLQVAADKAKRKEVEGVIGRIREAIEVYALTAEDLGLAANGAPKAASKKVGRPAGKTGMKRMGAKGPKAAPVVKFRNETGGTWGGLGKRPQWLRDALTEGKTLADFAVK